MVYLVITRCGADRHASPCINHGCNDVSLATPDFKRGTTRARSLARILDALGDFLF